eukprot:5549114-Amphidinium_carterae.3
MTCAPVELQKLEEVQGKGDQLWPPSSDKVSAGIEAWINRTNLTCANSRNSSHELECLRSSITLLAALSCICR